MTCEPKFIAFYLPQYHCIPENDDWWGKDFTEWVRVKNAKPLFNNHNQPRIPYEYYDLKDVNVMRNQARMAKEYGIYGFCYYHYWFNGKLLLEKPLEQMLSDKEVDIPFCFSWANETWTRAWDGDNKKILISQHYGNKVDWIEHIKYLVPFFTDERYIKVNGKPVFLIYQSQSFIQFDEMIDTWNEYLISIGLNDIFIAEMLTGYQKKPFCIRSEAVVEFEPQFTSNYNRNLLFKIKNLFLAKFPLIQLRTYRLKDYDKIWNTILKRKFNYLGKTIYLGAFPDWDNTPRFKAKSLIYKNVSPQKFQDYLLKQTKKSESEFIFINAWNEWAEGAYLEPDKMNNYAFLEAVKSVFLNTKQNR